MVGLREKLGKINKIAGGHGVHDGHLAGVGEGSPRRDLGRGGDVARASWRCDQVHWNDASPCPGDLPR